MASAGVCSWVTLATNDQYAAAALVLAHSLRSVSTSHRLTALITPSVSLSLRGAIGGVFDEVVCVDVLDSRDEANLALLRRPELGVTLTKLHAWRLTQYTKCVFLDADCLVMSNCDDLFERDELSAAPDIGWPDCFNSGVFVFTPSLDTFNALLRLAESTGSFDGGDQGLLNEFLTAGVRVRQSDVSPSCTTWLSVLPTRVFQLSNGLAVMLRLYIFSAIRSRGEHHTPVSAIRRLLSSINAGISCIVITWCLISPIASLKETHRVKLSLTSHENLINMWSCCRPV